MVDEITGLPLEGANIIIEGVTNQTTTDQKGRFELRTGQKFPYNIIVTFVGYEKKLQVANGSPVSVKLKPTNNNLDDVVVVGYGTQSRKNLVGSVAKVDPTDTKLIPEASFDAQLQGKAAGVQINTNTGVPGSDVFIRVRGLPPLMPPTILYIL
ncbi:carboxypeptidase-like regulatory domain-containing protein [Niabella sp. W65]|nr:carboxypeptidase-like regulatory domain-containing protein [Niabella sp. W65]MCH7364510.1 carboxypeptidase-like regulatory domain-containing protein [Niabella sp. W65]